MAGAKPRQRRCEYCERAFFAENTNSRYCTRGCKDMAYRDRRRNRRVRPQNKRPNGITAELALQSANCALLIIWAEQSPASVRETRHPNEKHRPEL